MNYYINSNNRTVELWSTKRLPFEPKCWLKTMRDDLKDELKNIKVDSTKILYGCYQSATKETGYDVENILFYNVGSSAFSHLKLDEILFKKSGEIIENPLLELEDSINSYSLYKLVSKETVNTYWQKKGLLASWEHIPILSIKDPYSIWYSTRKGKINFHGENEALLEYGLEITLHIPRGDKFSLPSEAMKKLLDGVICAFHVHNGLNEEEVAKRLATKTGVHISGMQNFLQSNSNNILGRRSIFNLRMDSLICNPADESCVFIRINCIPTDDPNYLLSGELFLVESR